MTRILISLLITVVLVGCGTQSVREDQQIDEQCVQVAKYARAVATLKGIGVKETDIDSFSNVPAVLTFPFQKVKHEMYQLQTKTPAEAFELFYEACVRVGYDSLVTNMNTGNILDKPMTSPVAISTPTVPFPGFNLENAVLVNSFSSTYSGTPPVTRSITVIDTLKTTAPVTTKLIDPAISSTPVLPTNITELDPSSDEYKARVRFVALTALEEMEIALLKPKTKPIIKRKHVK
jgi:hypothetical protein